MKSYKTLTIFIPLLSIMLFSTFGESAFSSITISTITHQGAECFKIATANATFILEKNAGGFSSIIDKDGTDWVQFNQLEKASYPASAAGDYRGVPNLVFKSDDGGAGHPGFTKCTSRLINGNTIRTTSQSGKWQWTWAFFDTYAQLTIEKVDPAHAYWFL